MLTPAEPLVVLGIVLDSNNRVLLIRRSGQDRWIFPGGQNEPGESDKETVVREVIEETGVKCQPLVLIGGRTHPESNRAMVYWRCRPLSDSITVSDTLEIAEARWVSVEESLILLGSNVFEPIKDILMSLSTNMA
jgi:8-oxo-dGTP pyrophosphatase MutT (NUDIX family)